MSAQGFAAEGRISVRDIRSRKGGAPLVCLTAYTAPMAGLMDPFCDILLVGDSVGMVVHGLPSTVGVTLDMMILHGRAVMRGAHRAMVVVDMPFGSFEGAPEVAFENAVRVLQETGAQAVKIECAPAVIGNVRYLVERGVPVMGHVGLRPQAVLVEGGFRARGREAEERNQIVAEMRAAVEAGVFALVIEGVAESLASELTAQCPVPTIGIGASSACDGQILVTEDMLGLFERSPRFVRRYGDLRGLVSSAVERYAGDVAARRFPGSGETYFSARRKPGAPLVDIPAG
ncbi:MAG: 3-methyl-2-oxobutanoate hydroxymethyltransferase [Pseudomonadota bacterium]|jgi:3-methyl-2-oxobutanoate hydroxymethyltransferase